MDALGLIAAISGLALAYAALSARWLGRATGERGRVLDAVLRTGAAAMTSRATRVVALPLLAIAGAIFGLHALAGEGAHASRLEEATWALVSLALGALSSWGAGLVGALVSARAAARAATAQPRAAELDVALRGASVASVVATALPLFALVVLYAVALVVLGSEDAPYVAARRLLGFPLGVALHGAALQVGAATYAASARDAEARLAAAEPSVSPSDPRNPARIASLVAAPARVAARAAEAAETLGVELVGALLVAAAVAEANRSVLEGAGVRPIALFALPLVARAYGAVASIVGIMAVRADELEHPADALSRGHWVAAALQLAGFSATSWILLRPWWAWLSTAAAIGVAAGYGVLLVAQYAEDARYAPVRAMADAVSAGTLRGAIVGLSAGLRAVPAPATLAMAVLAVGQLSGEMTGLAHGGLLGVVVATGGFLGISPFVHAAEGAAITSSAARTLRGLHVESTLSTDEAPKGDDASGSTAPFVAIGGLLAALVLVWAGVVEVDHRRALAHGASSVRVVATLDPATPATVLAAIAGALLVFWFAGRSLRAVDATRAGIAAEARRLLQWLPRDRGRVVFPAEGIVDAIGCVDVGTRVAVGQALRASFAVVAVSVAIGAVFRWTHALGAEAVIALAWVVTLLAAPLGLALAAAAAAWGGARRFVERVRPDDSSEAVEEQWSRVRSDARALDDVGAVIGGGLATATSSIAKLVAAAALAFLPLFL